MRINNSMKEYSIFERGMHWVALVFVFLEAAYNYYWLSVVLKAGEEWLLTPLEMILQSFLSDLGYTFFFVTYLLLFLLQRKTKKNISIFFTGLLTGTFIFKYISNLNSFGELKTILNYLLFIIFCLSIFSSQKIMKQEGRDDILDME